MDILSDIAEDYLADIEVLTEAREEFEKQMDAWWSFVMKQCVEPALKEKQSGLKIWHNKDNPGMCHFRAVERQQAFLEITDPRTSKRKFYTVSFFIQSQPALKKLRQNEEAVKYFDQLAMTNRIGGQSGLRWSNTELAREDIKILPNDPEKTAENVRDAAVRFLELLIEHHRVTCEDAKN